MLGETLDEFVLICIDSVLRLRSQDDVEVSARDAARCDPLHIGDIQKILIAQFAGLAGGRSYL